ncbi:hypothetical protein [Luteibacter mycovicinus]|uniref:hypothetical protein n=1 Tax=Luteibacter mycovicinus TaxID=1500890 RepID=UPI0018CE28C1|nr:hypothetical protein [Luteibacter sp. 9143a]
MKTQIIALMLVVVSMTSCSKSDNRSVLDQHQGYACKAPARTVYAAWGQAGLSKSCIDINGKPAGTLMTAEWGRIFSIENFDADGQHRVLDVYDEAGNVSRHVVDHKPSP